MPARVEEVHHAKDEGVHFEMLVEITERSSRLLAHGGRTLKDGLPIMIVILLEPAQLLWFRGRFQLATHLSVLRTGAGVDRQSLYVHSCRLLPKRCGVWISAISRAVPIGPIKESAATIAWPHVSGSPPTDPAARLDAPLARNSARRRTPASPNPV